jgi:LacI family transcriptional regulator
VAVTGGTAGHADEIFSRPRRKSIDRRIDLTVDWVSIRRAGSKLPRNSEISQVDVARHAQVSLGTVSRVMSGQATVDPQLRRRVLSAARNIGYVPKMQRLCLGVVTGRYSPGLPVGYVSVVSSLISQFAAAQGTMVELIDIDELDSVYERHVDAVIGVVFDDRLGALREVPKLPIITINQPMVSYGIDSIYTDHFGQGVAAAEHLIRHGHQRIGMLAIEPNVWGTDERVRGYRHALQRNGLTFEPEFVRYTKQEPVYDAIGRWRRRGVTGILNFSEDTALEVLHILSNVLGLTIGGEVSTVTLEDLPIYRYVTPPQTVIRQPLTAITEYAVDVALRKIQQTRQGEEENRVIDCCFEGELIERDSVADLS